MLGLLLVAAAVGLSEGLSVEGAAVGLVPAPPRICSKLSNVIEPKPDTGSQPGVAVKPEVQQRGLGGSLLSEQHLMCPEVTSVYRGQAEAAYREGLMKPTEGRPFSSLLALTREISAAMTGVEAEVPNKYSTPPWITVW